jgi:hypothetical protein
MTIIPEKSTTYVEDEEFEEIFRILRMGSLTDQHRWHLRFAMRRPWLLDHRDILMMLDVTRLSTGWVKLEGMAYLFLIGLTINAAFYTGFFLGTRFG